jgi:hypothetical protein
LAIRYQNELNPDGLRIVVPWDQIDVGTSVFIPCINERKCRKQIAEICLRLGIATQVRYATHNQHLGLRMWRTA